MTWLWITVFLAACIVPMVAWVYFTEIRGSRDIGED
jgi:hypothetical protein